MSKNQYVIYCATNLINDKRYIGQSCNYAKRKRSHLWSSKQKKNHNSLLHKAIDKYGVDSFKWEIISYCDGVEEANEVETLFISRLSTICPNGYNLSSGGKNFRQHENVIRKNSGANNYNSKIDNGIAIKIYKLALSGTTIVSISNKFNLSKSTISGILHKRSWKDATKNLPDYSCKLGSNGTTKLTDQKVMSIINDLRQLSELKPIKKCRLLADKYQVSYFAIYDILSNRRWKHLDR